jgi:hypothetical protein
MNPLRWLVVAVHREDTLSGEINGSTPEDVDPSIGGDGGPVYEANGSLRPDGAAAAR